MIHRTVSSTPGRKGFVAPPLPGRAERSVLCPRRPFRPFVVREAKRDSVRLLSSHGANLPGPSCWVNLHIVVLDRRSQSSSTVSSRYKIGGHIARPSQFFIFTPLYDLETQVNVESIL